MWCKVNLMEMLLIIFLLYHIISIVIIFIKCHQHTSQLVLRRCDEMFLTYIVGNRSLSVSHCTFHLGFCVFVVSLFLSLCLGSQLPFFTGYITHSYQ